MFFMPKNPVFVWVQKSCPCLGILSLSLSRNPVLICVYETWFCLGKEILFLPSPRNLPLVQLSNYILRTKHMTINKIIHHLQSSRILRRAFDPSLVQKSCSCPTRYMSLSRNVVLFQESCPCLRILCLFMNSVLVLVQESCSCPGTLFLLGAMS